MLAAFILSVPVLCFSCSGGRSRAATQDAGEGTAQAEQPLAFSGDSALFYVKKQTDFGPRKPGTKAHYDTSRWITEELERHGAVVLNQTATLKAFDGTRIPMINILGSINPEAERRLLLVAHWDTRPWADEDPDPAKRREPVMGANDGASGVAVLLELARVLGSDKNLSAGIDFLMVDAEDWGESNNDDSWAMGTRYFVENPPANWKMPEKAVVVDMVGDPDATFVREYFSEQSAPDLNARVWAMAEKLGYGNYFINRVASAVTDDHVELIKGGIPSIDIIDFHEESGFPSTWHTTSDTYENVSAAPMEAVGRTLESLIRNNAF